MVTKVVYTGDFQAYSVSYRLLILLSLIIPTKLWSESKTFHESLICPFSIHGQKRCFVCHSGVPYLAFSLYSDSESRKKTEFSQTANSSLSFSIDITRRKNFPFCEVKLFIDKRNHEKSFGPALKERQTKFFLSEILVWPKWPGPTLFFLQRDVGEGCVPES